MEIRTDCDSFEAKAFPAQCGSCQTDGHYLCKGCRYIADFDDMELSDNRMSYYPQQEKKARDEWDKQWEFEHPSKASK